MTTDLLTALEAATAFDVPEVTCGRDPEREWLPNNANDED